MTDLRARPDSPTTCRGVRARVNCSRSCTTPACRPPWSRCLRRMALVAAEPSPIPRLPGRRRGRRRRAPEAAPRGLPPRRAALGVDPTPASRSRTPPRRRRRRGVRRRHDRGRAPSRSRDAGTSLTSLAGMTSTAVELRPGIAAGGPIGSEARARRPHRIPGDSGRAPRPTPAAHRRRCAAHPAARPVPRRGPRAAHRAEGQAHTLSPRARRVFHTHRGMLAHDASSGSPTAPSSPRPTATSTWHSGPCSTTTSCRCRAVPRSSTRRTRPRSSPSRTSSPAPAWSRPASDPARSRSGCSARSVRPAACTRSSAATSSPSRPRQRRRPSSVPCRTTGA